MQCFNCVDLSAVHQVLHKSKNLFGTPCRMFLILGMVQNFTSGGIAGIAYWIPGYPLDNVKARIQIDSAHGVAQAFPKLFWKILQTEGTCKRFWWCKYAPHIVNLLYDFWQSRKVSLKPGNNILLLPRKFAEETMYSSEF